MSDSGEIVDLKRFRIFCILYKSGSIMCEETERSEFNVVERGFVLRLKCLIISAMVVYNKNVGYVEFLCA